MNKGTLMILGEGCKIERDEILTYRNILSLCREYLDRLEYWRTKLNDDYEYYYRIKATTLMELLEDYLRGSRKDKDLYIRTTIVDLEEWYNTLKDKLC